jgi:hypothetical protein
MAIVFLQSFRYNTIISIRIVLTSFFYFQTCITTLKVSLFKLRTLHAYYAYVYSTKTELKQHRNFHRRSE